MKTQLVLYMVIVLTVAAVAVVSAQQSITAPLPVDLKIVLPDPIIPPEQAKFSGKWSGIWGGNVLEHIFVVEEVGTAGAKVVYAYGTAPTWNIHQPGWFRANGQFVKGALVVETRRATITYRMNLNGTMMSATYEGKGTAVYSTAKLSRIE